MWIQEFYHYYMETNCTIFYCYVTNYPQTELNILNNKYALPQFLKAKTLRAPHLYGSDSRFFTKFQSHSHLGVHSSKDSTRMRGLCFQAQGWGCWQTQFLSGCWPEILGLHHMGLTRGLLKSQDSLLPSQWEIAEREQENSTQRSPSFYNLISLVSYITFVIH